MVEELEVGTLYSQGVLSSQYGYDIVALGNEQFKLEKRNAHTYYAQLHHPTWMLKITGIKGKERPLFICPGVQWCDKKCGSKRYPHNLPHIHTHYCDEETMCPGKCIPVSKPEPKEWIVHRLFPPDGLHTKLGALGMVQRDNQAAEKIVYRAFKWSEGIES